MAGGLAWHMGKERYTAITVAELRKALADPRIQDTNVICPTANYPGLAISTGDHDNWYLGYIDLFDGEVVINPKQGMRDGKNPFHEGDIPHYKDDHVGPL